MVQPWERVARQRITQSFSPNPEIFFPPLGEDEGTEGPMIIEAEIGGHYVHRMYVDDGSALEIFGEVIWPTGQIQLLVKIEDEEHSASAWMNFMVVRSSSLYNGIIGRLGVKKLQAVPSSAQGMLKILVEGGVITLKSSKLVPQECAVVSGRERTPSATKPIIEERIKVATNPEVAERLQKWSIELGEYAIHYRPRVSVKGQILADFVVERLEEDSPDTPMEVEEKLPEPWILFIDGSSCTDGSGAGLILTNPEGMEFTYALRFRFDATNNEAEYEALIAGLGIAEQMGIKNLQANIDSRLVANQVNGTYVAKKPDMIRYLEKVKALTGSFKAFTIKQIPRSENKKADALSKIASTSFAHLSKQVLVEELKEKSISEVEVLAVVEQERDTWMTPIFKYLAEETLPSDMKKARAIRRKSWRFAVINGTLYKKSFLSLWLRFGLLGEIISDNGKQFRDDPFKDWNKSKVGSKNSMEELPHVLWAHRTMIKSSNGDTSFSLTYGTEAVILAGIGMPTIRTAEVDLVQNNEALEINLDLLEENREEVTIREAKSKAKMEKYYNAKVRSTSFKPGDLVYRNNDARRAQDTGNLGPKWEGLYEVTEALGKGAYKLKDRDEKQLPRTWNVSNLKKCYIHAM
ncbi:reverse transcriptase domain-containing protein [Tanacetum coccineum]